MHPLVIYVDKTGMSKKDISRACYALKTLLVLAGFSWRFVSSLPPEGADISYGVSVHDTRISILRARDLSCTRPQPRVVSCDDVFFLKFDESSPHFPPLLRLSNPGLRRHGNRLVLHEDIVFGTYYLLNGLHEASIKRGKWDSCDLSTSFLYSQDILQRPLVSQWASLLRHEFREHDPIPPWPNGKTYALALGHDVDYPEMVPWIESLRYLAQYKAGAKVRELIDILKGRESFWRFQDWMHLEKLRGFTSTFYFCSFKGSVFRYLTKAPDPFYDVHSARFRDLFSLLRDQGFEIGLHPSFLAYTSRQQFQEEKSSLEEASGVCVLGNRHHYFHMDPENPTRTAQLHFELGFLYDSSLAFSECSGFRRSACHPFRLYGETSGKELGVLQLPLTLMDDHLYWFGHTVPYPDDMAHVAALQASVAQLQGLFVANWHVRRFNSTFFPGWTRGFEHLLTLAKRGGDCYCDTAVAIARHWIFRENLLLTSSSCDI